MKILILGAGQVGSSLAENLASEDNDITVVDLDGRKLAILQDRLDIRTVRGRGSHPEVLNQAGCDDADMLIAVTNSDETNMIACQISYTIFHTPMKIARVRSNQYLKYNQLFSNEALPVDVLISPEQLVTDYITRLIAYPGALQVLDFAGGLVQLVAVRAFQGGPLLGHELQEIRDHMPAVDTRVAAIYRKGHPIIPTADTIIEELDEVFFIVDRRHTKKVMSELRRVDKPFKRIIIAGGGNIGQRLARALESRIHVKIIEHSQANTKILSEELEKTIVLLGDASDEELLIEEDIEGTDVFCALTNDDEANIMSALLAKRLGARKVMALINRAAYVDLVESSVDIDIAISPQEATIGSLLAHVRRGDVEMVHSLRKGVAEAIEAIAHGDKKTSKVVGRTIEEIPLPPGTNIGAIVRFGEVIIVHHDTVIESDDHVILFLINKRHISDVERLFQVGVTFI
ncbi:MAG: Trk system potassium transporter TrkA [gamma proteobacterium symbiont of Bathyaustriella thionipta]|nr:Trk system potassium transporter TrkA [gamma proteobacterium symbiont of Bathyaustriella thionipta]MCU7948740.1 Trk system potassium transporter TrkA [gamma proteobacterium symbiont of Bathyaustriella thionipta]MCU7953564.1 Trk system potassium transporter TrkA [gamma proteobacterium symbiont of Bathyaustriella thionipta]MCU7955223.1 Trk system potassium transporter TrkA [gamma proteobacterium symbiont of Bathyaustriella thionipta]MCU7966053.1 Trk system potassium transporter TrkA [gamma pro